MLRFYDLFSVDCKIIYCIQILCSKCTRIENLSFESLSTWKWSLFFFWKTEKIYWVKYSKVFCILNSNWYNLILLCFLFRHICIQISIRLYQLSALTNHFQLQFPLEGQIEKEKKINVYHFYVMRCTQNANYMSICQTMLHLIHEWRHYVTPLIRRDS